MTEKCTDAAAENKTVAKAPVESGERLSTTNQEPTSSASEYFAGRVKSMSETLLSNGLMPAVSESEVPTTLARAATLFSGQNIGIPSDAGRSSGSAVSALMKASGSDVSPTMDIGNLHAQMKAAGWHESDYKPGDALKPGTLLFTSLDPINRNVGIVGENGHVYSHNARSNRFEGRDNWSSKFVTVMRAPGSDK